MDYNTKSRLTSTDESESYPFSNSSSDLSSTKTKKTESPIAMKKTDSAFSYVKPKQTQVEETCNMDHVNFTTSYSFELSKSSSNTSSSSFLSTGSMLHNHHKCIGKCIKPSKANLRFSYMKKNVFLLDTVALCAFFLN